jgi:hypothetical protein
MLYHGHVLRPCDAAVCPRVLLSLPAQRRCYRAVCCDRAFMLTRSLCSKECTEIGGTGSTLLTPEGSRSLTVRVGDYEFTSLALPLEFSADNFDNDKVPLSYAVLKLRVSVVLATTAQRMYYELAFRPRGHYQTPPINSTLGGFWQAGEFCTFRILKAQFSGTQGTSAMRIICAMPIRAGQCLGSFVDEVAPLLETNILLRAKVCAACSRWHHRAHHHDSPTGAHPASTTPHSPVTRDVDQTQHASTRAIHCTPCMLCPSFCVLPLDVVSPLSVLRDAVVCVMCVRS